LAKACPWSVNRNTDSDRWAPTLWLIPSKRKVLINRSDVRVVDGVDLIGRVGWAAELDQVFLAQLLKIIQNLFFSFSSQIR
jgi:hypothetical protein